MYTITEIEGKCVTAEVCSTIVLVIDHIVFYRHTDERGIFKEIFYPKAIVQVRRADIERFQPVVGRVVGKTIDYIEIVIANTACETYVEVTLVYDIAGIFEADIAAVIIAAVIRAVVTDDRIGFGGRMQKPKAPGEVVFVPFAPAAQRDANRGM